MKKGLYFILIILFYGCDSVNSLDCFQDTGNIIEEEFTVAPFKKIQVWERVKLIVSQSDTQSVRVETGENLINEILVKVEDSILTVSDRNSCNFVRDYDVTRVYVSSPNIEEIRNSSGLTVESSGVLRFHGLSLIAIDPLGDETYHIDGDFDLDLDVITLGISAAGISTFYLRGKTQFANFGLYDGDVRVEAANLEIGNLNFIHRSTNKLIVNPLDILRGEIRGIGDVIAINRPPIVEVTQLFTGRLIFE
jgi:hypothetical protein